MGSKEQVVELEFWYKCEKIYALESVRVPEVGDVIVLMLPHPGGDRGGRRFRMTDLGNTVYDDKSGSTLQAITIEREGVS